MHFFIFFSLFLNLAFSPFFQQGGAIVLTVSQTGSLFKPRNAYLPQELLGKVKSLENLFALR